MFVPNEADSLILCVLMCVGRRVIVAARAV